jgi:pRiA4b ORF-3-like protein
MSRATTHILRDVLDDDATISREIEIDSENSLSDPAKGIVEAFGFEFIHAFGFYPQETRRGSKRSEPKYELFADMGEEPDALSVSKTRIADAFPQVGHTMMFLVDYDDNWRFTIEVIGFGEKAPKVRYPSVHRLRRAAVHAAGSRHRREQCRDCRGRAARAG